MRGSPFLVLMMLVGSPVAAQDLELEFTEASLNRLVGRLGNPGLTGIFMPSGPLGALGYSGCSAAGTLGCATGTTSNAQASAGTTARAATNVIGKTQPAAAKTGVAPILTAPPASGGASVPVSLCIGPDGQPVVVPGVAPVIWQWWITEAGFTVQAQQLSFTANVKYRVGREWFSDRRTVSAAISYDAASNGLAMKISSFKVPIVYSAYGASESVTEVDVSQYMSFAIPISAQPIKVTDPQGRAIDVVGRAQTFAVELLPGKVLVKGYVGF